MLFTCAILLAPLAAAAPLNKRAGVFTTSVHKRVEPNARPNHIVQADRSRIDQLRKGAQKRQEGVDADITNGIVSYLADIGFGTPATTYSLIVDTGSSNTFAKNFKVTSDAVNSGDRVSVSYGSGSFSGTEYTDTITLAPGLVLKNQGVARATSSQGFNGVDGILGVGPVELTDGTVSGQGEIPTVLDTAVSEGLIDANVLGVYFAPTNTDDNTNGELTYGGVDTSKTTGDITYQARVTSGQAAPYWGLRISSSLASGTKDGIVDTGTTLVYLPSNWYSAYKAKIPSAVDDQSSGLLRFPKSSLNSVPDISFTIGGKAFVLNKYAQLVEQQLYDEFGLSSQYYYSWVSTTGSSTGLSYILGQKFLERFYSVYDVEQNRIGFASTSNSNPTSVP